MTVHRGPDKSRIVPGNVAGAQPGQPTSLVHDGLLVPPFAFRSEINFLATGFRAGNPSSPEYLPRARRPAGR